MDGEEAVNEAVSDDANADILEGAEGQETPAGEFEAESGEETQSVYMLNGEVMRLI